MHEISAEFGQRMNFNAINQLINHESGRLENYIRRNLVARVHEGGVQSDDKFGYVDAPDAY